MLCSVGVEVGSLTSLDTGVLRGVVELLYRVPSLSEDQYTQLARLVQSSHLPARDAGYLLQVMQHRCVYLYTLIVKGFF